MGKHSWEFGGRGQESCSELGDHQTPLSPAQPRVLGHPDPNFPPSSLTPHSQQEKPGSPVPDMALHLKSSTPAKELTPPRVQGFLCNLHTCQGIRAVGGGASLWQLLRTLARSPPSSQSPLVQVDLKLN